VFEFVRSLALVLLIIGVGWFLTRPRPVFVIRIRNGVPRLVQGQSSGLVLEDVAEVCRMGGVTSGTVSAWKHGKRIRLKCSRSIPAGCQQQLRNMMLAEL
jgi:hypothetical protein